MEVEERRRKNKEHFCQAPHALRHPVRHAKIRILNIKVVLHASVCKHTLAQMCALQEQRKVDIDPCSMACIDGRQCEVIMHILIVGSRMGSVTTSQEKMNGPEPRADQTDTGRSRYSSSLITRHWQRPSGGPPTYLEAAECPAYTKLTPALCRRPACRGGRDPRSLSPRGNGGWPWT